MQTKKIHTIIIDRIITLMLIAAIFSDVSVMYFHTHNSEHHSYNNLSSSMSSMNSQTGVWESETKCEQKIKKLKDEQYTKCILCDLIIGYQLFIIIGIENIISFYIPTNFLLTRTDDIIDRIFTTSSTRAPPVF